MVVVRTFAPGRGGAGEIERPQPCRAARRADQLHHIGIGPLLLPHDLDGERRDVDRRLLQRQERSADGVRLDRRQITLHVDDELRFAARIDRLQRLEDAVGAGAVVRARHRRLVAGLAHGLGDVRSVGRHHHAAEPARGGSFGYVHDHRTAGDVGERLARQALRGHAGRDQDDDVHRVWKGGDVLVEAGKTVAKGLTGRALICVARRKQKT